MNPLPSLRHLLLAAVLWPLASGLFGANPAASATHAANAFDLAKAKAAYPLDTCVVSGDPLEDGDMGPPVDYVYKQKGQPDRLVRLCCADCIGKFQKDPAKYLKMIDDAAAAKAAMDHPKPPAREPAKASTSPQPGQPAT